MKLIDVGGGRFAMVDDEDYGWLSRHKWRIADKYPCRNGRVAGKYKTVFMHRAICGAKPGEFVDHIDGNPLNNQRNNLRKCSAAENQRNRIKHKPGTSRFKGVCFDRQCGRWKARITVNNRQIRLGEYHSEIDAARAYNEAAKEFFKEYARLNEI